MGSEILSSHHTADASDLRFVVIRSDARHSPPGTHHTQYMTRHPLSLPRKPTTRPLTTTHPSLHARSLLLHILTLYNPEVNHSLSLAAHHQPLHTIHHYTFTQHYHPPFIIQTVCQNVQKAPLACWEQHPPRESSSIGQAPPQLMVYT